MRDQVDAAEPGRAARRHDQLRQRRRLAAEFDALRADEVDVLLVSPERLANPRFAATLEALLPRPACWSSTRPTASPTGASTSAPTTSGSPACSPPPTPGCRCWPPPPRPTRGSPPTSPPSSATTRWCCAARWPERRCGWPWCPAWARCSASPGSPSASPRCPARASSTRSPSTRPSGWPASCAAPGHEVAAYTGQPEPDERARIEAALRANELKAVVATSALGHGLRQARPRLLRPCRLARLAGRLLPAGRPRRPGARPTPSPCCCPRRDRRADLGLLRHRHDPRPGRGRRCSARLGDGRRRPVGARDRGGDRAAAWPARRAAEDPAGRRRGRPGRCGWVGTGRPWHYDADKYGRVSRRAGPRPTSCGPTRPATRLPHEVPAEALDDPSAGPCGRCSVCTGTLPRRASWRRSRRTRRGCPGLLPRAGRRHRPAPDVAVRGRRPTGTDRPRTHGRTGSRAGLRRRPRLVRRPHPSWVTPRVMAP